MKRGSAVLAAVVGGLLLAAASATTWVTEEQVRDVGGVKLHEVDATAGIDIVPQIVPAGLGATGLALLVGLLPSRPRRAGGWLLAGAGVIGMIAAVIGLLRTFSLPGDPAAGSALAIGGGLLVVLGGGALTRAGGPVLDDHRYTVEGSENVADDEWRMASQDEEDT